MPAIFSRCFRCSRARRFAGPAPKRGGGVHRLARSGAGIATLPRALRALTRAGAQVILSNPDDRLEPAGQAIAVPEMRELEVLQRVAGTPRREGAALPAGHHLRFAAQRPGAGVRGESRRGRLRRLRAHHRRRPHPYPELHRQTRSAAARAVRRGPGKTAHRHARPETGARTARARAQARHRSHRAHHRGRDPRAVRARA